MPPANASASSSAHRWPTPPAQQLLDGYLVALEARGARNRSFLVGARVFLSRWPDPQVWAAQPLPIRLSANSATRPLLNYLMLTGHLQPGYDYLLERKLPALLREARVSPLADELARFLSAATELGYTPKVAAGLASQVAVRLLIQTGRRLGDVTETDLAEFDVAITARENTHGRTLKHYRTALQATHSVLYHLGAPVTAAVKQTAHLRWPWRQHFTGVPDPIVNSLVAYLECASGTRTRATVLSIAARLGHFARFLIGKQVTVKRW